MVCERECIIYLILLLFHIYEDQVGYTGVYNEHYFFFLAVIKVVFLSFSFFINFTLQAQETQRRWRIEAEKPDVCREVVSSIFGWNVPPRKHQPFNIILKAMQYVAKYSLIMTTAVGIPMWMQIISQEPTPRWNTRGN